MSGETAQTKDRWRTRRPRSAALRRLVRSIGVCRAALESGRARPGPAETVRPVPPTASRGVARGGDAYDQRSVALEKKQKSADSRSAPRAANSGAVNDLPVAGGEMDLRAQPLRARHRGGLRSTCRGTPRGAAIRYRCSRRSPRAVRSSDRGRVRARSVRIALLPPAAWPGILRACARSAPSFGDTAAAASDGTSCVRLDVRNPGVASP
jgi:hypothetical protein